MAVTIKEIAALANVSRGTVDKVLNNRPGVRDSTREKVLKIANELHYQPNFIGKALVHSNNPIKIGIILTPDYNPFVQELLEGIQNAQNEFSAFGIEVITKMMTSLEPAEQLSIINELVDMNVSGMAVFPLDNPHIFSRVNHLIENQMAVITFNSRVEGIHHLSFIGQNHYKGGRTAAGLVSKICPPDANIGVIISSHNLSCHQDRLRGFEDKLAEEYYCRYEIISLNPTIKVDMPKIHEKAIIRMEPNEVAEFLDNVESGNKLTKTQLQSHEKLKTRDLALLTLMLGTGIRVSECVGLDINDVDFDNDRIRVIRKGGSESFVYFGDEVREALLNYLEERKNLTPDEGHENALFISAKKKRLCVRSVELLVKKYAQTVTTVKHITPHKLRSTYGTNLYQESQDIYLVADVLGHKDVNTTRKHYAEIVEENKRSARNIVKLRKD